MGNSFGGYGVNPDFDFGSGFDHGYGMEPGIGEGIGAGFEGVLGVIIGIYLIFALVMLALAVVMYVFQSVSMYTVAKRRMIRHPWLAWVPYGSSWMLGCISDQYQYVAKGKVRNRRKVLLGLNIAIGVLGLMAEIINIVQIVAAVTGESVAEAAGGVLALFFGSVVLFVLAIVYTVFYYMALYDLYTSCDPNNKLVYLLLSIFVGVTQPFLMFACRKQDKGMPPRKEPVRELPEEAVATKQPTQAPVEEQTSEE